MQLPPLSEIERLRKKLGLTQIELAQKASVSQSLIARLEAQSVDPRYSKVARLFEALNELKGKEVSAFSIASKDVVGIQKDVSTEYAAEKLREFNVSQMPVFDGERIVGSFSEKTVLEMIAKGQDVKAFSKQDVQEHMDEAFPQVKEETPLSVISALLEHNTAVMIHSGGVVSGIITRADLLKVIHQ